MSATAPQLPQQSGALRRRSVGPPAARSVLLTVLGEYAMPRGGSVWQETLVAGLVALGHTEQTARQAVARSTRDGWLEGERFGRRTRMTVTPETRQMLEEGRQRIFGFGPDPSWDGRWLVVVLRVPEERRRVRHHVRTRLARAGMGSLGGGVWIGPHVEREPFVAEALRAAGVEAEAVSFRAETGSIGSLGEIVGAWELDELTGGYRMFSDRFEQLSPLGDAAEYRAQTELVHAWRRFAFLDPGLPGELLPADWPRRPAYDLFSRLHEAWRHGAQRFFARLEGPESSWAGSQPTGARREVLHPAPPGSNRSQPEAPCC